MISKQVSITKTILLFIFLTILLFPAYAGSQTKVGYIDSKKIIDNMQEASDAKTRLDNLVSDWEKEITVLQDSLKFIKDDYEKKNLILTETMKAEYEKRIKDFETSITNFRQQKFGEGGEYFVKQNEFMNPVYDKIFKAIEVIAKRDDYDFVFDRSSSILLLFVNERHDLTLKVQRILEGKD
ncbi:MAG: OmpH family outer membrane protein [Ignavibacteria bacterium]|nr:OmpH family outer membrane protein [Ignavibacteria bacterium]